MATKIISKKNKKEKKVGAAVGAKAEDKEVAKITSNPRLVEALTNHDAAKAEAKSYLVEMATIVQEEQLSKEEVLASIMEARKIDRKTAGEQYSRMKKILNDANTLQELKDGVIDLATARARTVKPQEKKSTAKTAANAEKVITRAISQMLNKAKETGMDLTSLIATIKAAAKKAGVK